MLNFPIPLPLDPKEAAVIEKRRRYESERRERIFNARERLYGVDKKMLEEQMAQRKARENAEHQNEVAYEKSMLQHSQLALSIEKNMQEEKRRLLQELNTFRATCQRPQDGASFDLNCPDRLKKSSLTHSSDDNLASGISSVQKFEGEDWACEKRTELQRKQQKAWLDQQLREKEAATTARQYEEKSQESTTILLDKKAVELDRAEQEVKRLQKEALVEFNKALMAEREACRKEKERLELLDNRTEMTNCITGDFLSENPNTAVSAFGPHRFIPDRWKGMSPEQREQIRKEQFQQALEEKKRKEDEKQRNAEWEACINEMNHSAMLIERELMRKRREENKALLNQNQVLSHEQRARNEYINKYVYSNVPSVAYFDQFNTSTR